MFRERILPVAAYAVVHSVATMYVLLSSLGAAMQGFDGGPTASPLALTVLSATGRVLSWPLLEILPPTWFSAAGVLLLVANGVIWGVVGLCGWSVFRRARRKPTSLNAGLT